ncbi:hypothetical protein DFH09DRAFT_1353805 [Mycena vulgaris]|nr:hypothetical protein DFH09DRAFT_1353805 [Mycena vulgaris]
MRDFAQELVDEILDHASPGPNSESPFALPSKSDQSQIGTLGLVCKQWLPRSRLHLFSSIKLRPDTVGAFFDLVDTSSSVILSVVQTLDLSLSFSNHGLLDDAQMLRFRASSKLTHLRMRIPEDSEGAEMMKQLRASLQCHVSILGTTVPSISTLSMTFLFLSMSAIAWVVSCFPALELLDLAGVEISAKDPSLTHPFPSLARLHTLTLDALHSGAHRVFSFLQSLPVPPTLTKMDLNVRPRNLGALDIYFQHSARHIQHLRFYDVDLPESAAFALQALQHATNLRHLYIMGSAPILDLISAVSSPKLNSMTIYQLKAGGEMVENPWSAINSAFADSRFRALESFQVASIEDAGKVILCYDHLLTLEFEIEFVWRRPKRLSFFLFTLLRYGSLFSNIGMVILNFNTIPPEFRSSTLCHAWNIGQIVLTILQCVLVGNVLGLRIYAMYNFSKAVLCVLFSAGVVTTSLAVWSVIGQSWTLATDVPGCDYAVFKQRYMICLYETSLTHAVLSEWPLHGNPSSYVTLRSFYSPFFASFVNLSESLAQSSAIWLEMALSILAIVNLGNILMFYLGDPWTASSLSWFTSTISVTMVSRLMLSLHKAADVGILATDQNVTSVYFHSLHHNQPDEESTAV